MGRNESRFLHFLLFIMSWSKEVEARNIQMRQGGNKKFDHIWKSTHQKMEIYIAKSSPYLFIYLFLTGFGILDH